MRRTLRNITIFTALKKKKKKKKFDAVAALVFFLVAGQDKTEFHNNSQTAVKNGTSSSNAGRTGAQKSEH